MKKLKELLSDSLIYGISSVLARFINYLLVPLHTKVFSTAQYGVVSLIYVAISFLNVVFTFGMESAYLRYAKERESARNIFKTIQLSLLGMASLLALLMWLFAPLIMSAMNLPEGTQNIYLMMIGIIWFDTLALVPFAELRLVRKSLQYAAIRTGNVLINIGLNIYLILYLGQGIEAIFVANLAAAGVTTAFIWVLTADMWKGHWNRAILRKVIWFGLPFVPAGLGFVINEGLDRYLLEYLLTDATITNLYGAGMTQKGVIGVYSACYKVAAFMLLLIQMFRMAWQPFFLRHSDGDDAPELYAQAFFYFNIVAAVIFLGVGLFAEQIVQIKIPLLDAYLIGEEYWGGLTIVPIILGAYWFHGWYMNFSAGIYIKEKTSVLPKITLFGALITIIANVILIPFYGMMGAALATLVSYASMAMLLYWQSSKMYAVPYRMGKAFGVMVWVASCLIAQPVITQWAGSEWKAGLLLLLMGVGGLILFVYSGFTKRAYS